MFFVTYLRWELRHRIGQAVATALGLALGVGLVVTAAATSAGVAHAESGVLGALYGPATDVAVTGSTVTGALADPAPPGTASPQGALPQALMPTPDGLGSCAGGKCVSYAGKTLNSLQAAYSVISAPEVAQAARLPGVTAAAGGITLVDTSLTFPATGDGSPLADSYTIDGVDTADATLGPLGSASLVTGHSFTAAEADADVTVVNSAYARSHGLALGSAVTIGGVGYTVIGIVSQPRASNPPSMYVPLAGAQAMAVARGDMAGEVNTIYLATASAADIPAVSGELSGLLPGATVTTASSLASQVTGSLSSAARLTGDLGRWLPGLVLAAAFLLACVLSMAAMRRRAGDLRFLKAIGWRLWRVLVQVYSESAAIGIAGAAAGVGLGFAGAAIVAASAPTVTATDGAGIPSPGGTLPGTHGTGHLVPGSSPLIHVVSVPLDPSVSIRMIVLAVVLALAAGLLAGVLGSWRIARLWPAGALARVP